MAERHSLTDSVPAVKLTYDDFVLFPEDGNRHELIDGEHYVTPSPNMRHQLVAGMFHGLIWTYLRAHPIGQVFMAPLDVVASPFDVVEPDIMYLSHSRASVVLTEANIRGVPELVIEVASKGTRKRDETVKCRLYERAGVTEYWIVDPRRDSVRMLRRDGEAFGPSLTLSREAGDILSTPLLPGLDMSLSEIFGRSAQ